MIIIGSYTEKSNSSFNQSTKYLYITGISTNTPMETAMKISSRFYSTTKFFPTTSSFKVGSSSPNRSTGHIL